MVESISLEVGYVVTFGDVLSVLLEEAPNLYTTIMIGIASNIVCGFLLILIGGLFIVGKGKGLTALVTVMAGVLSMGISFLLIGGVVGLIGGVIGCIGGYLSLYARPKKELETLPPPSFPTTGAEA